MFSDYRIFVDKTSTNLDGTALRSLDGVVIG